MISLRKTGLFLLTLIFILSTNLSGAASINATPGTAAASQLIYADSLAANWEDWSWAAVDFADASPVHSGTASISVTFGGWEGLYLHHAGLDTLGFTHLRFYIHGGSAGGQAINVYATLQNGSQGPSVAIPAPLANTWTEVNLTLTSLGASNTTLTGLVWQGASNNAQPTVYIDDISLVSDEHADGPALSNPSLPRRALAPGDDRGAVRVQVSDPQGLGDIASVTLESSRPDWASIPLYDDGLSSDAAAGDGIYGSAFAVPLNAAPGEYSLLLRARDQAGNTSNLSLGALIVLAAPGGSMPAALPHRPAWGSNAWSETIGQDWQENSGVPWDYVYQYITYEWYRDGWGGNFVHRFVSQAWSKGYTPMVVVYMMYGLPPTCGEGGACYAGKLQNASAVAGFFAALRQAAQEAAGDQPVIFNLEPDFYGYMQQYSNSDDRPAGVQPDDPASYPVALNIPGYPNNLAGFGQRMVDVIRAEAPNALIAPEASMWATNGEPFNVTASTAAEMGRRTARFIDAMGGADADLLIVEWSDRDSGSGLRPWWDDTDQTLPRPTRAILWENALSVQAGKRMLLWQIPVGNMGLDNTCDHYQDNRAAYLFTHPRDWFDAGVMGVLFGGGAECMTNVDTDGGFVAGQGSTAYNDPLAPQGLELVSQNGIVAVVRWQPLSLPDLWGYRLTYRPAAGGAEQFLDTGLHTSASLVFPGPGRWRVTVQAVDAMGQLSPFSTALDIDVTGESHPLYLPLITR